MTERELPIVACPHCETRVVPTHEGTCPACRVELPPELRNVQQADGFATDAELDERLPARSVAASKVGDLSNTYPVPTGIKNVGLTVLFLVVVGTANYYWKHVRRVPTETAKIQVHRIADDLRLSAPTTEVAFQRFAQATNETDPWNTKIEIRLKKRPGDISPESFRDFTSSHVSVTLDAVVRSAGPDREFETLDDIFAVGVRLEVQRPNPLKLDRDQRPNDLPLQNPDEPSSAKTIPSATLDSPGAPRQRRGINPKSSEPPASGNSPKRP